MSQYFSRWLLGAGLLLLAQLTACDGQRNAPSTQQTVAPSEAGATFDGEVKKLDAGIEHAKSMAATDPNNHLIQLEATSLHLERASLTGDYADYAQAQRLLGALSQQAKPSASLCLAWAKLHFTLHRLHEATRALNACPSNAEPSVVAAMRADIALHSGRYREAEAIYRQLVNEPGIATHYVRLAMLRKWMGAPGEAAALLEAAEKRYHGGSAAMAAWFKVQRGLVALDRGRFDEALAMYRLADDAMQGWWLVDEHIAEVLLLTGNKQAAKQIYESVIQRAPGPEFLDALSAIERQNGNHKVADELRARSSARYEQTLIEFPQAAAGHALDHFLMDSRGAERALALAQDNFKARSNGESAIALAKAWMLVKKPDRAVALIEKQLADGWDTPHAYWILGEARQMLGQSALARKAKDEALRRNSASEAMYSFVR